MTLITQTRIIKIPENILQRLNEEKNFNIGIVSLDDEEIQQKLKRMGFENLEIGEKVLPSYFFKPNKATRVNANGSYLIRRDLPKETKYYSFEWTRKEWAGRGQTVDVTDYINRPYERYVRDFLPPYAIEFIITEIDNKKVCIADVKKEELQKDHKLLKHTINLFLEIFGHCAVFSENIYTPQKVKRLNWEVLPKGKYPWERIETNIVSKAKPGEKQFIQERMKFFEKQEPDFVAEGNAGFRGYLIFGFEETKLFFLESCYFGNATYLLNENWEILSQKTKAELLNQELCKDRIIHDKKWFVNVQNYFKQKEISMPAP